MRFCVPGRWPPIPVTTTFVESLAIEPALFGIGTVAARYTYRIGPTTAGRLKQVDVDVGDRVHAGQQLGEMDPVDLDDRIDAQTEALKRADAAITAAEARIRDALAQKTYADAQIRRYERLFSQKIVSAEVVEAKRREHLTAEAALLAARADYDASGRDSDRVRAERQGLIRQRASLRFTSPVDGLVVAREAEPGGTVVAGQPVIEMIDPGHIWINVRFDQLNTTRLKAGLRVRIALRSRPGDVLTGEGLAGRTARRRGHRGDFGQSGVRPPSGSPAADRRIGRSHRDVAGLAQDAGGAERFGSAVGKR